MASISDDDDACLNAAATSGNNSAASSRALFYLAGAFLANSLITAPNSRKALPRPRE